MERVEARLTCDGLAAVAVSPSAPRTASYGAPPEWSRTRSPRAGDVPGGIDRSHPEATPRLRGRARNPRLLVPGAGEVGGSDSAAGDRRWRQPGVRKRVPAGVAIWGEVRASGRPQRSNRYSDTRTLSLDAAQLSVICVAPAVVPVSPGGVEGGVASGAVGVARVPMLGAARMFQGMSPEWVRGGSVRIHP
jgi:hypothetical protein